MAQILQSGGITPGHFVTWVTDGVVKDGGAVPGAQKVIAKATNLDFDTTTDQPIILPQTITAFNLTGIIITNASISLSTVTGGFYPQASKGGTDLVAAGQVYSSLSLPSKLLYATLETAVATTRYSIANLPDWAIYLSLTVAQGAPASADVYILGIDLTP